MIIAPSVGVFRPLDDVDEGDHVDEGQTVGHLDGPGTSTPVCSPFRGQLVGMLVHRGRTAPRRVSPSRGCESPEHAGVPSPDGARRSPTSGSPTPTSSSASTRPTQWIVERTGIRERRVAGPDETTASLADRRPAPPRSSAPDSPPTPSTCSSSRPRPRSSRIPHTGAFVGDGIGAALRVVRPRRRRAPGSSTTLVVGSSMLDGRRARPRARRRRRDAVAHRRPRGPRHVHPLRRRRGGVVLSASRRRRPRAARLGPRLRRLGDRAARDPRRRQPHADDARDGRDRRPLPADGGPGGLPPRGARRRRLGDRHAGPAPASTVATSTGSSPTRPTSASSRPPPAGSASRSERTIVNIDRYGNTSRRVDPARARRGRRRRPACTPATSCCSPASVPGMTWAQRAAALGRARDRPAEPRVAFVTGGVARHRPGDRDRARATRATASRSATRRTTTAPRRPQAAVEAAGGTALAVQADVDDADVRRRTRSPRSRTRSGRSSSS